MGHPAFHERLADLGHDTYESYLRSDHWRRKRRAALAHHGERCKVCGCRERLQVHHRRYDKLGNEPVGHLVVLCGDCHEAVHALVADGTARLRDAHTVLADNRKPKRRARRRKTRQPKRLPKAPPSAVDRTAQRIAALTPSPSRPPAKRHKAQFKAFRPEVGGGLPFKVRAADGIERTHIDAGKERDPG